MGLTREEIDSGILEYIATGSPRAVEKKLGRKPGFGNRFITNDIVVSRIGYLKKASYVEVNEPVATFAEVEKVLSDHMRGVGDEEEIAKIEDLVDEIQNTFDAASTRVKIADLKLKQKKVRIGAAETLARIHGAFDPKGTGAEDAAAIAKQVIAGLKKSGVKPSYLAEILSKKEVIDVVAEPTESD